MRLTPAEQDRLTVFTVAELARRRRARGRLLSAPEVIALITNAVLEAAWDGLPMDEVVSAGQGAVKPEEALPGVAGLVRHIEVDALFPTGTALVALDDPLGPPLDADPGAILPAAGQHWLNADRPVIETTVTNTADVVIRVSSHYPFWQANPALRFDRDGARGYRLDVMAGSSVAFDPGEKRTVRLVALGGNGDAPGMLIDTRTERTR